MKTQDLIQQLAKDTTPVRRLSSPGRRLAVWSVAALLLLIAGVMIRGLRPDLAQKIVSYRFTLEALLIFALSLVSALSALASGVPGAERPVWTRWAPVAALTAWLALLCFHMAKIAALSGPGALAAGHGTPCIRDILLLGLLPGAGLTAMMRRAAPIHLGLSGALAALAAGSLAALGTQFACRIDDPLHTLVWHAATVLAATVIGSALGKKLLRW